MCSSVVCITTVQDRGKNVVTFGGDVGSSWSVEEMFRVNEGLIGRKFTYDGNAQTFGEMASGVVRHRDLAGARPGVTAPPVSAPIRRGNYFEGFAFDSSAIMAALDAAL